MVIRANTNERTGHGDIPAIQFKAPATTAVAVSSWDVNFPAYALKAPPAVEVNGKIVPSVSLVGNANATLSEPVYPDFSLDPGSIPLVDAASILAGSTSTEAVRGKRVFITGTSRKLDSTVGYFGHGWVPSAMVDISGASVAGRPTTALGGMWLLVLICMFVVVGNKTEGSARKFAIYSGLVVFLLAAPALIRESRIITDVGPAAVFMLVYIPARLWRKWRLRVQLTSSDSGLPNIEAMATEGIPPGRDVIAVSISHYEQMLASLPREHHGECARQIGRRLAIAFGNAPVFDNGNGHFVWTVEPYSTDAITSQLEGLKALFSSPLIVDGHVLDTNVHFGIDRNIENMAISRIKSAIASSTEAQAKGKLYEEFGRQRMMESSWELSIHARIDEALHNGDIWLAFQPKLDLRSGRISGAETLIRWNDPVRGAIPPDAFILQAERAGRIDAITYWVLEQAIAASRNLEAMGEPLLLSVNMSAWMVDQPGVVERVGEIAATHNFDCAQLIFEVTETFSMTNREMAKQNLAGLRELGFRLSIDDFGTGQASLAYLSEIPSDEIKLDKRFVQAISHNDRDRAIVRSVIQLGHALGQEIVAEGVEDGETLKVLETLGCDLAQGYFIGRPVRFEAFVETLHRPEVKQANYS